MDLLEHRAFLRIRHKVDNTVRGDNVCARIRQRDIRDIRLHKLRVLVPALLRVAAREINHLGGHVDADSFARRTDAARGEENIETATGAEVDGGFALWGLEIPRFGEVGKTDFIEVGEGERVATGDAEVGFLGDAREFLGGVAEGGGDSGGVGFRGVPGGVRAVVGLDF